MTGQAYATLAILIGLFGMLINCHTGDARWC